MENSHTLLNENPDPPQTPQNITVNSVDSIMEQFRDYNMTGEIPTFDLRKINFDPNRKYVNGLNSFSCSSIELPGFLDDKENINYINTVINSLDKILSDQQRNVADSIIANVKDTLKFNFNIYKDCNRADHSILNAPAGTGKSMLLIYIALKVNLLMGCSSGCLIFSPSYAGVNALYDKLSEVFNTENGYTSDESKKAINIVKSFLNINN